MSVPVLRYRIVPTGTLLRSRMLPSVPALQISMRVSDGFIQWRRGESGLWQDIVETVTLAPGALEILALLLTVDGAGSLLDADLLDGQHANEFQPIDASLTAYAALVTAADKAIYFTEADVPVTYDISSYGRTLANLADETALEALLDTLPNLTSIQGLTVTLADAGADALWGWDDSANAYVNLSAADVRTALALVIGTNVQAFDADLTTLSTAFTTASASGAASLDFHEDTDNGTNRVRLIGPASTADVTVTLPAATDTLVGKATTDTLTNKSFDANGTGNSLTNVEVADFAATAIVTAAEGVASSDNDTSVPTTAAVIDAIAAGGGGLGDGDKGDVAVTSSGTVWTVQSAAGLFTTNGQVAFLASQNASAGANTLDDYEEGSTTPTVVPGSGSFTTVSCALSYTKIGDLVAWRAVVTITTAGTAAGDVGIPLPFTANGNSAAAGYESQATGFTLGGRISGTTASVFKYDGTTIIGSGRTLNVCGLFKV